MSKREEPTILALDLGSVAGWALIQGGRVEGWGQEEFPGDRHKRLWAFQAWLNKFMVERPLDVIAYERPFTRGLGATRSLWGMAGIVDAWSHGLGSIGQGGAAIDIVPSTLKKWATGSGRAEKWEMIAAAHKWAPDLGNNDEHAADAIVLGMYVYNHLEMKA